MIQKNDADSYFRKKISDLLDDISDPLFAPAKGNSLEIRLTHLTGALIYAKDMGDIDSCYYRIFTDTLASLAYDIAKK